MKNRIWHQHLIKISCWTVYTRNHQVALDFLLFDFRWKKTHLESFISRFTFSLLRCANQIDLRGRRKRRLMLMNSCTGGFLSHNESCHSCTEVSEVCRKRQLLSSTSKVYENMRESFPASWSERTFSTRESPVIVMTTFMISSFPFQYQRCCPRAWLCLSDGDLCENQYRFKTSSSAAAAAGRRTFRR